MYRACGSFSKTKTKIQKFKETKELIYIYQNELHKACFTQDMIYDAYEDLIRRTDSDKMMQYLRLLAIQSMMDINKDWHQVSTKFLTKKTKDTITHKGTRSVSDDQQLVNELN